MNDLRSICVDEMEGMDTRLRELGAASMLAAQAARQLGDDGYADMFGHMKNCLDNLRANMDEIRGAVTRLAIMEEKAS